MALRDAGKNLLRLREISVVVVRHGFGNVLDRSRFFERVGFRPRVKADAASARLSAPARFRQMLSELGPTFVKLGQVLSSRPDLLPPEWVEELSKLQDEVQPMPLEEVQRLLREGLGEEGAARFESIDPEPIASASIAQVHAARTHGGEDVVVKIQRPDIEARILADLDLLRYAATILERIVDETGITSFTDIVSEFEKALVPELDFLHEARNIRLFHEKNDGRAWIRIPRVHESLTSRTVLTMERLRGEKINRVDAARHSHPEIADRLIQMLFEHLFVDGLFHGDPHPGNLFVLEDGSLGLVDFGLVGHLTRQMQETLISLCMAVALKDAETVARLLYRMGIPEQRVNIARFRSALAEIIETYLPRQLQDVESTELVRTLVDLCLEHGIKIPKEYALLTKAFITLEGLIRQLDPHLDLTEKATPYARRLLSERLTPSASQHGALRTLLHAHGLINEVPAQISQILLDLESGKSLVNVRSEELRDLVGAVRWLGMTVFSGMVASALILGSFFILSSQTRWEVGGVPVLAVFGFVVPPVLFTVALVWTLMGGRLPRLSLRRLFRKRR